MTQPYDPSDRQHDGRRIDALAEIVRRMAVAPTGPRTQQEIERFPNCGAWAHLTVRRHMDGGLAVELQMPSRASGGTYYSSHPLMDETWDGLVPVHYATPEDAVRALLDNVLYRLWPPHDTPKTKPVQREPAPANIGGDNRF